MKYLTLKYLRVPFLNRYLSRLPRNALRHCSTTRRNEAESQEEEDLCEGDETAVGVNFVFLISMAKAVRPNLGAANCST